MSPKSETKTKGAAAKSKSPVAKKTVAKKTSAKKGAGVADGARLKDYSVLDVPLITEKGSQIGAQGEGRHNIVFRVARTASKIEIREAVERIFSVKVERVRTCNYMGKMKRTQKSLGRQASFKKAYITLAEGHRISVVEGL